MRIKIILTIFIFLASSSLLFSLELPLGKGQKEMKVIQKTDIPEFFGRGVPIGPSSFRFLNGSYWVSDSLSGRLINFSANGEFLKDITVTLPNEKEIETGDFAFTFDKENKLNGFWLVLNNPQMVICIDLTGKIIAKTGKEFNNILINPNQIEENSNGFILFDKANSKIYFGNENGEIFDKLNASGESFAKGSNKITFFSQKKDSLLLITKDLSTKEVQSEFFPISAESNPKLISIAPDQGIFFTFDSLDEENPSRMAKHLGKYFKDNFQSSEIEWPAPFLDRFLIQQNINELCLVEFAEGIQPKISLVPFNFNAKEEEASKG